MLRHHKRPDLLVEIARSMPEASFVVCGGPTTYMTSPEYSEKVIADLRSLPNVDFLGRLAPDKAHEIIANAAVLLSTSDEEGFPNTFAQAWSNGTPVVSLRIDPDRIIERYGLGAISGSVEQAARDIGGLLRCPRRRGEIGERAREFVVQNYSARAVVETFETALQETA
jgi:glycosyltransferase involved in cell wall biosynthesis